MAIKVDKTLTDDQWERYVFMRDHGHSDFTKMADKCNRFYLGDQWDKHDRARLAAQRRPALTQNQILPTISVIIGEQIKNRAEISYRARNTKDETVGIVLAKLYRYISDDNQLDWLRRQVFEDGIITGRGFFDVRVDFSDNIFGDVRITSLNPKNVLIDPDGEEYDPDTWNDVIVSKWWTPSEVGNQYGKDAGDYLKAQTQGVFESNSYDRMEAERDRFGTRILSSAGNEYKDVPQMRCARVIERQHRVLEKREMFVDPTTGDMRPIPTNWDYNRIAAVRQLWGLLVVDKLGQRVRWTVTAADLVLHDDYSPYEHFSVVPFFPYFRRGKTLGAVENLIDPQEYLNKITSQELHVVNTTANSGWVVRSGKLVNMSTAELAQRGAETGLVLEVSDEPGKALEKIQPNQYPSGLDRMSYKAAEAIKSISLVGDTMMGMDREDVAAKAIQAKQTRGSIPMLPVFDNLNRTDFLLAHRILNCMQTYYTAPRVFNVVTDYDTQETEPVEVNVYDEAANTIVNDLTTGEYSVIVISQPTREAFEDSQFDQALALKVEAGIAIPDEYLIKNSRLADRGELLRTLQAQAQSPEARAQAQLQQRGAEAEVAKTEAEAQVKQADAQARLAKAQATIADQQRKIAELEHKIGTEDPSLQAAQRSQEMQMSADQHALDNDMAERRFAFEQRRADEKHAADMRRADEKAQQQAKQATLRAKQSQSKSTRQGARKK